MKKNQQKTQRQKRVRVKVQGTNEVPRLSVFRSNRCIYAQLIDDGAGKTLFGMVEQHDIQKKATGTERAKELGAAIAKKALEKNIQKVKFDRGHYQYHGRVKALADGAREGGLQF